MDDSLSQQQRALTPADKMATANITLTLGSRSLIFFPDGRYKRAATGHRLLSGSPGSGGQIINYAAAHHCQYSHSVGSVGGGAPINWPVFIIMVGV